MKIGFAQINPTVGDLRGNCELIIGAYERLALYKRPELYALLALLAALGAPASFFYERRRHLVRVFPSDAVLAAASASIVLLLLSVVVWLFAPTA